ncbi:MAG: PAS domain S-box protein [Balneolaceae bacterium]|nr:PAS domain S-box protein [Balneolaceae bacterium]
MAVKNETDRHLIFDYLPDCYEFLDPEAIYSKTADIGLIITDYASYKVYRDVFMQRKEELLPVHLPILLLIENEQALQQNGYVWNQVDDIIDIPVSVKILNARIENLLRTHRYSRRLKKSLDELEQEKEKYRLITEHSTDLVTRHALDGTYLYASPASRDLFGYTPEELVGTNMFNYFHPDDRSNIKQLVKNTLEKERYETRRIIYRLRSKSGSYIWVETTGKLIADPDTGKWTEIQATTRDISERVEYEKQLKEEKEFIKTAVDNMPGIFYLLDEELNYIFWNKNLYEELGYSDEDIQQMEPLDFFRKEDQPLVEEKISEILSDGHAEMEVDIIRKDGNTIPYYLTASKLIQDGKGFIIGSGVDVSERVEAVYLSEQHKKLLDAIINQTEAVIYVKDEDGRNILVNDKYLELFGLERKEVIGRTDYEIFSEKESQKFLKNDRIVWETDKYHDYEEELIIDGETRNFYTIKYPLKNVPGYEQCLCGISTDITEVMKTRNQLEKRTQMLLQLFDNSPAAVVQLDEDENIIRINDRFKKIFQYSNEEAKGRKIDELITPVGKEIKQESIFEAYKRSNNEQFESVRIRKDGTEVPVMIAAAPVISGGKLIASYVIYIDISERVEMEEELKNILAKLSERVKEQTCLYNISRLNEQELAVKELLSRAVTYLPDGWQYPEITEAQIEFDGNQFSTEEYRKTTWMQTSECSHSDGKTLVVRVSYLEEKPVLDEGPFIHEERQLIDAVCDMLLSKIDRITTLEKLKESEKRWEQLVQKNPGLVQIVCGETIEFINQAGAEIYGVDNPDELIGIKWPELVQFEDERAVHNRIKKVMNGESVPSRVLKAWTLDGSERFVELQSVPVIYKGKRMMMTVGQEVTDRVQYEEELKQSLKEKEVLLQEIHHRVKNNLAVVSGLLQMQRFELDDESISKVLLNSEMRIKSMALIHEKLYQSDSLSEIDLNYYIEDLASSIEESVNFRDNIRIEFDCQPIRLNVNQAVPCSLILNELISNAVEHAFPDNSGGLIKVKLSREGEEVKATVEDNGTGMPDVFFEEAKHSMGYTIIETLVRQLNADLDIKNDSGTKVSFTFKKQSVKGSSSRLVD